MQFVISRMAYCIDTGVNFYPISVLKFLRKI